MSSEQKNIQKLHKEMSAAMGKIEALVGRYGLLAQRNVSVSIEITAATEDGPRTHIEATFNDKSYFRDTFTLVSPPATLSDPMITQMHRLAVAAWLQSRGAESLRLFEICEAIDDTRRDERDRLAGQRK